MEQKYKNNGRLVTQPPQVLDATCGSRSMWFDKNNDLTCFVDQRDCSYAHPAHKGSIEVHPDVLSSFTALPFDDESFYLVVFDPPHMVQCSEGSYMKAYYGKIEKDTWKDVLSKGFSECFRVLKPGGTLIFKWCDVQIPVSEILKLTDVKPMFGHRSGKQSNTHWMAFYKPVVAKEMEQ